MSEEHHQTTTATAEAIEADFGGRWGVWLSDTGRWWAARTRSLTSAQINAGCVPFIEADNPDELTEHIRQQDRLSPGDRDTARNRFRSLPLGNRAMPAEPVTVEPPKHALHALTSYELRDYRRELERAIALSDTKDPTPPAAADLRARLDDVIAEQDDRKRLADA